MVNTVTNGETMVNDMVNSVVDNAQLYGDTIMVSNG